MINKLNLKEITENENARYVDTLMGLQEKRDLEQ